MLPSTTSFGYTENLNERSAEEVNEEMRNAVLPITVFVGILSVLGFFGNLLVLYVFLLHYRNCNFRYFVLCLALTDITSCLTTMPGEIVTQMFWYDYPYNSVCKIKSFFNMFTVVSEAICLVTIAIDRYRKICRPFAWQITPRTAKILCFCIFTAACVIASPVPFLWGTHTENIMYRNRTVTVVVCEKDERFLESRGPLIYTVLVEILCGVSLMSMIILYVTIARSLQLARSNKLGNVDNKTNMVINSKISSETRRRRSSNTDDKNDATSSTSIQKDPIGRDKYDSEGQKKNGLCQHGIHKEGDEQEGVKMPATVTSTDNNTRIAINSKIRRKALIMFILTLVFIITTILYMTLLSFIAKGVLPSLSDSERAVYFFFFRLYFINHAINPVVYGVLDPEFRNTIKKWKDYILENLFKCC